MKKRFKAVELKYLDDETVMKIREWRNSEFVRRMVYQQDIISEETHREYIDKLKKDKNRGLFVFYLDDEPFGVYQYIIHKDEGYVENGHYLIKKEYQELGYGTLLSFIEMEIIFNVFNYSKSYGEVLGYNKNVISMNKKMGARLEKILPSVRQANGKTYDVYCFCSEKEDWMQNKLKYQKLIDLLIDDFDVKTNIIY